MLFSDYRIEQIVWRESLWRIYEKWCYLWVYREEGSRSISHTRLVASVDIDAGDEVQVEAKFHSILQWKLQLKCSAS